jgi:predicted phage replisome organizer
MADVKWIRITIDMFDNRKIKYIRTLPEGNNIVLIWVMLLTMAGRCNSSGMIFLTENIPYDTKILADEIGFEENVVKIAISALRNLNMISTNENGFICIPGWEEYQSADKLEKIKEQNRIRQANYREKQNSNVTKTLPVTQHNAIELELELDKDINNTCSPEDERLIASKENFEKIYALYPKKTGKAKALEYYMQWHKGRKLSGFDKAIKLTNKQMYLATMKYVAEKKDSETDLQYYKGFDVFMNKAILDYLEGQNE